MHKKTGGGGNEAGAAERRLKAPDRDRCGRCAARPSLYHHDIAGGRCALLEPLEPDQTLLHCGGSATGFAVARHSNGELALWQRRFWEHTIRDDRDFERHVDYIHFSPVKHNLVTRVRDWSYPSFHRYMYDAGCCRRIGPAILAKMTGALASGEADPGFRYRSTRATFARSLF